MAWLYTDEWAAGFFDGEGNIYLRHRPNRRQPDVHAQVTQKDPAPLRELQARWGGSLTETRTPSGCYRWRVASKKAEMFLRSIRPHLLVKAAVVEEALAVRERTRPYHRRSS